MHFINKKSKQKVVREIVMIMGMEFESNQKRLIKKYEHKNINITYNSNYEAKLRLRMKNESKK